MLAERTLCSRKVTQAFYLVSCVVDMAEGPLPARTLYRSDWFVKARTYVQQKVQPNRRSSPLQCSVAEHLGPDGKVRPLSGLHAHG